MLLLASSVRELLKYACPGNGEKKTKLSAGGCSQPITQKDNCHLWLNINIHCIAKPCTAPGNDNEAIWPSADIFRKCQIRSDHLYGLYRNESLSFIGRACVLQGLEEWKKKKILHTWYKNISDIKMYLRIQNIMRAALLLWLQVLSHQHSFRFSSDTQNLSFHVVPIWMASLIWCDTCLAAVYKSKHFPGPHLSFSLFLFPSGGLRRSVTLSKAQRGVESWQESTLSVWPADNGAQRPPQSRLHVFQPPLGPDRNCADFGLEDLHCCGCQL